MVLAGKKAGWYPKVLRIKEIAEDSDSMMKGLLFIRSRALLTNFPKLI